MEILEKIINLKRLKKDMVLGGGHLNLGGTIPFFSANPFSQKFSQASENLVWLKKSWLKNLVRKFSSRFARKYLVFGAFGAFFLLILYYFLTKFFSQEFSDIF